MVRPIWSKPPGSRSNQYNAHLPRSVAAADFQLPGSANFMQRRSPQALAVSFGFSAIQKIAAPVLRVFSDLF
jgi:hypothetical protein